MTSDSVCGAGTSGFVGDLVVDRVDAGEAIAEARETLPGDRQGLRVSVDADDAEVREALEERLGVTAHAERAVHGDRAVARDGGLEQLDAPVEQNRDVE